MPFKRGGAGVGRIRWRDLDGNGVINEKRPKVDFRPTPDFTYGINVYLQYRDFDFSMLRQGAQGQDVISDLKRKPTYGAAST